MTESESDKLRAGIRTVGIIYRERAPEAEALAHRLRAQVSASGRQVWSAMRDENSAIEHGLPGTDVALVLGGDGTILSVARLCSPLRVPILGINFGRVGFLTELEPDEVEEKLPLYLSGDYWMDERTMLQADLGHDGRAHHRYIALNDIVLARGCEPRVIRINVWIDGHHYNTTVADGIIVCTATGSTAYNLAAGGPILHPQVRNSVITPIAPHLATDRSLILEPNAVITLELEGDSTAILSADGQINAEAPAGTRVTIHSNAHVTKFLRRRPPTYFYRILTAKLRDNL